MARFRLGFDEHFFERDEDPVHLKKMWYVLGASMYCYSVHRPTRRGDEVNMWCSSNIDLLGIIKKGLQSEHHLSYKKVVHPRRRKISLSICSVRLAVQLAEYNLSVPKWEREMPDELTHAYADHFARGFFDAIRLRRVFKGAQVIGLNRAYPVVEDIVLLLSRKKGMQFHERTGRYQYYITSREEGQKIPEYLYQDWKFIQEQGLYLPNKLEQWVQLTDFPDPRTNRGIVQQNAPS